MPLATHYGGHGAEVMRSMRKTYRHPETAKRVFYATEQKRKAQRQKQNAFHGMKP